MASRWLGLACLSLGVAMIIVDATIVNVAVPVLVKDLGLDSSQSEWVNTTYALVFAALLVTLGRIGDLVGRRATYLAGTVVFAVASIAAGLAPNGAWLLAARLGQGLGGAAILPATQSILNTTFRGRDRAIAFGIWGATIGGVAAIGPLAGGWLTTNLSWRWAFYVNLPVAIVAIVGTLLVVKESRDEHGARGWDPLGFILVTGGLSAFVFGLVEGRLYGWLAPQRPFAILGWTWPSNDVSVIPVAMVGGLVALVAFAVVELSRERAGKFFLFDFDLWRFPAFRYGNLAGTIVSLGEFGLLFVLPLFLQAVVGYSAFDTGLTFLALALGSFVSAGGASAMTTRLGARRVVTIGMGLEAIGVLGTTLLVSPTVNGLVLAVPLFVYGIGVGFATAQLTSIVLSEVPASRSGLASGTNSTMRQVGSALGIAILGTVLFASLANGTRDRLTDQGLPSQATEAIVSAMDASAGQALPAIRVDPRGAAVVPAIETSFADAARSAGLVAFAFIVLGFLLSLWIPAPHTLREHVTSAGTGAEAPGTR
ncbi:MAG TPA: DHA2 family efflux MFS transporter permease subunit [Candidatus Limnocylindria bacterium]